MYYLLLTLLSFCHKQVPFLFNTMHVNFASSPPFTSVYDGVLSKVCNVSTSENKQTTELVKIFLQVNQYRKNSTIIVYLKRYDIMLLILLTFASLIVIFRKLCTQYYIQVGIDSEMRISYTLKNH